MPKIEFTINFFLTVEKFMEVYKAAKMEEEKHRDIETPKITSNIEEISNDVLGIILSKLNFVDRSRCERVCSRWQIVARNLSWNRTKFLELDPIKWGKKPQGKSHKI